MIIPRKKSNWTKMLEVLAVTASHGSKSDKVEAFRIYYAKRLYSGVKTIK